MMNINHIDCRAYKERKKDYIQSIELEDYRTKIPIPRVSEKNQDVISKVKDLPNVKIDSFSGLLIDYTREKDKKSVEQLEEERAKLLNKVRSLESDKSKGYRNLKIKQRRTDNLVYKIVILGLIVIIVAMLIIAGASSSPNIINYRNKIQNEYSEWEKQLEDREKALRDREQQAVDEDYKDIDTY